MQALRRAWCAEFILRQEARAICAWASWPLRLQDDDLAMPGERCKQLTDTRVKLFAPDQRTRVRGHACDRSTVFVRQSLDLDRHTFCQQRCQRGLDRTPGSIVSQTRFE